MSIYTNWIITALQELETGEKISIPVPTKPDATNFVRELKEAREAYSQIDFDGTARLKIYKDLKEKKYWAVITKIAENTSVGIKEDKEGKFHKVFVVDTEDRLRKIRLMIMDGKTKEEILELVDWELSQEEEEMIGVE
jgi:dephospho-CoA kinase